jgi:hypothetical protein
MLLGRDTVLVGLDEDLGCGSSSTPFEEVFFLASSVFNCLTVFSTAAFDPWSFILDL